ncbi:MAG: bleomycin resistance protein [Pseudonocardiaceae bacterium]
MGEKTIPILPCPSIPDVVGFYEALGFEVTHLQTRPNPYASLRYGDIELQFFGLKSVDPAASMSTCYVVTDRVDELYAAFRDDLKHALGKIPTRGIPRIGQIKNTTYGVRQFLMTDPGGNCIRIGQPTGESLYHGPAPKEPFARAVHNAWMLGISKGEPAVGARILDRALQLESPASAAEHVRALILRADLADQLGEGELAARLLHEATRVELTDAERASLSDDLDRANDLRESLRD